MTFLFYGLVVSLYACVRGVLVFARIVIVAVAATVSAVAQARRERLIGRAKDDRDYHDAADHLRDQW